MSKQEFGRMTQWVYNRLNVKDRAIFEKIATEVHPLTGKTRIQALSFGKVRYEGRDFTTYRLGSSTFKLGTKEWDDDARAWYNGSRWLMLTIGNVGVSAGLTRNPDKSAAARGYLWLGRK